jgi:hypothetical protein
MKVTFNATIADRDDAIAVSGIDGGSVTFQVTTTNRAAFAALMLMTNQTLIVEVKTVSHKDNGDYDGDFSTTDDEGYIWRG